jgi:hypothetical protein
MAQNKSRTQRKGPPPTRGPRLPEGDDRRPAAPIPEDAAEAYEARDFDRADEEDEGMDPGEIWPREEELLGDEKREAR